MSKKFSAFLLLVLLFGLYAYKVSAQTKPDTVKTGIYVTSIHDVDFKQQEYTIDFWLWLKYKNPDFDFSHNLEIPLAKTVDKYFETIDTGNGGISILMKLQCVMKDSWQITNFPFDKQTLRLSIENSQYDSRELVFAPDTLGKHFDPRFTLPNWTIDTFRVSVATKVYETTFGDESLAAPHAEYSSFRVRVSIERDAAGLFWKLFIGMYVAFLIAYVCFYIHADSIDSRFGLSVGALFAVIGNKYVVDASLPESLTFTLVDTLHGITLFFILCIVAANAWSLQLLKQNKSTLNPNKLDIIAAQVLLVLYAALNIYFIHRAVKG
ncbi:hypothetical protein [Parafilimonas sp.]|uniref:hypothetical protein n=1 Tax=Parafilimonas sp. TaxID=1969739 RepID=UPI0039E5510B